MKDTILTILKQQADYISGEEVSRILGVTRTTVWKAIQQLKEQGYEIDSVTKKGYKLCGVPDIVTAQEIKSALTTKILGSEVFDYKEVSSTNKIAKAKAAEGVKEGAVFIAEKQTAGRGRLGKTWESPSGTGIWMSLVLRPNILPQDTPNLTLVAGLAICKAIRNITELPAYIKWPNDIIINGKKVCGILTEMSAEMERVNYVIVGIGINVNTVTFPKEIEKQATSLKLEATIGYNRKDIISELLTLFEKYYQIYLNGLSIEPLLDEYKKLCITLQNEVQVITKDKTYWAKPVDIDKTGALIVDNKDGERISITSGEVSVRGVYGYY